MKGLFNYTYDKLNRLFSTNSNPEKNTEYFRGLLLQYNNNRKRYADLDRVPLNLHYYFPWSEGRDKHLNAELKCTSAMILFKNLGGHKVEYSDDNIVALTTGDLNDIVEMIRTEKLLPDAFIKREKEYDSKCQAISNLQQLGS